MPSSWTFERIVAPVTVRRGAARTVEVHLRNGSDRFGIAHITLLLERVGGAAVDHAERWTVGSGHVAAEAGQSVAAMIALDWRAFTAEDGSEPRPGGFWLSAGFAGEDFGLQAPIAIEG